MNDSGYFMLTTVQKISKIEPSFWTDLHLPESLGSISYYRALEKNPSQIYADKNIFR